MEWSEYEKLVLTGWRALMDSPDRSNEVAIQSFLETHPCMIPGAFSLPLQSGHYPFPGAVISQPILRGLGTKVPDFLWLASDSMTLYPVLVEIENPAKRWFTNEGYPHSDFTQAHDQLTCWKQWFEKSENRAVFMQAYQIPPDLREKAWHPIYILVYGSRTELEGKPALNAKREHMQGKDEFLMTFNRLAPDRGAENLICVRQVESVEGVRYEALTVPPTFKLGPNCSRENVLIRGIEKAIEGNPWIQLDRKNFLIRRIPYWERWTRLERQGIISSGDYE